MSKWVKRVLSVLLVLVMSGAAAPLGELAQSGWKLPDWMSFDGFSVKASAETSGDFEYSVWDGDAAITKYAGSASMVVIPARLGGFPVTAIGDRAFQGCTDLQNLTLNSGLKKIGMAAFGGCTSLKSLIIPDSVTEIESWYMSDHGAFSYCTSLESVVIGTGLEAISGFTFAGCNALKTVSLGEKITDIGGSAFDGCSKLTSITIPNSVKTIGGSAFANCPSLSSVDWSNSLSTIGDSAFESTALKSISFPATLRTIGARAFRYCTDLQKLTLNSGLETIGVAAFNSCTALKSLIIPDSVTEIESWYMSDHGAFSYCTSLESVVIGTGLEAISGFTFAGCTHLVNISYATNSITIYGDALPSSVVQLGNKEFNGYYMASLMGGTKINTSIAITLSGPGELYARFGNDNIGYVDYKDTDRDGLLDIWEIAGDVNGDGVIDIPDADPLKSDIYVQVDWMEGCKPSTSALNMVADSLATSAAGYQNKGINLHIVLGKELAFDEKTTWHEEGILEMQPYYEDFCADIVRAATFRYCVFGNQFELLDKSNNSDTRSGQCWGQAFFISMGFDMWNDTAVAGTFMHELGHSLGLPHRGIGGFADLSYFSVMNYWYQKFLVKYGYHRPDDFDDWGNLNFKNGFIGGSGIGLLSVYEEAVSEMSAEDSQNAIDRVAGLESQYWDYTITDGQATITGYTGDDTNLYIPSTIGGYPVIGIAYAAFGFNDNLTSVYIPANVTSIGSYPFFDCDSMTAVNVSSDNPNYSSDDGVLYNKAQTTLIYFPHAKSGEYRIPDGVTRLDYASIANCKALTAIIIPISVTNIPSGAFDGCTALTIHGYEGSTAQQYAKNHDPEIPFVSLGNKQITITFDALGGTVSPATKTVTYNGIYGALPTPVKTGYTFNSWHTQTDGRGTNGTGPQITKDSTVSITSNQILYAQWAANTYTVTLDKQSGIGGTSTITAIFNSTMPSATMPTRNGYIFGGYYDAANGTGTKYYTESGASATAWNKATNATLYAKWTVDPVALAETKTAKIAAINAVNDGLKSADYTAESWQSLQTAISTAIAQANAATTVEAVNALAVPNATSILEARQPPDNTKYISLWGKTTKYVSNALNWLLCIVLFGWIWMAF